MTALKQLVCYQSFLQKLYFKSTSVNSKRSRDLHNIIDVHSNQSKKERKKRARTHIKADKKKENKLKNFKIMCSLMLFGEDMLFI